MTFSRYRRLVKNRSRYLFAKASENRITTARNAEQLWDTAKDISGMAREEVVAQVNPNVAADHFKSVGERISNEAALASSAGIQFTDFLSNQPPCNERLEFKQPTIDDLYATVAHMKNGSPGYDYVTRFQLLQNFALFE